MTEKKRRPQKAPEIVGEFHAKTNGKVVQVERMVFCGLDESEIAYCLGIDVVTLQMHYKDQLEMGLQSVIAKVGGAQIKAALRGDSNAAQFLLRSRGRWVTPTKIEQDVTLTVQDKRSLMDDIIKLYQQARAPVTIEHEAQVKVLKHARPIEGSKAS